MTAPARLHLFAVAAWLPLVALGCDTPSNEIGPRGDVRGSDAGDGGACVPSCVGKLAGTPDGCGDVCPGGGIPTAPTAYFAVFVQDDWSDSCMSPIGSDGASIDAVGLFDAGATELGYLSFVRADVRDPCGDNAMKDTDEAKGPPDATLLEHYVTLVGGWLIGEFDQQYALLPSDVVVVYEVDKAHHKATDDPYTLFLAHDLTCGGSGRPTADCLFLVGEGFGQGTFSLPAGAF